MVGICGENKMRIALLLAFLLMFVGGMNQVGHAFAGETLNTKVITPQGFLGAENDARKRLFLEITNYVVRGSYYIARDERKQEKFKDCFLEKMMAGKGDPAYTDEINKALNACNPEDEYDAYLNPNQAKEFAISMGAHYGGLGITISINEEKTGAIINVIHPDSPLFGSTVQEKDLIKAIRKDRQSKLEAVAGKDIHQVIEMIRGESGSEVFLEIWRNGNLLGLFSFVRKTVDSRVVVVKKSADGTVAYIKFFAFGEGIFKDKLVKVIDDFYAQGIRNIIFDVRGNSGGILKDALDLSSVFLDARTFYFNYCVGNADNLCRSYSTGRRDGPYADMRVVILVDGDSASASEIFAGILQKHKKAVIIGEKTFGKGCAQTLVEVQAVPNALFKLTTNFFYFDKERKQTYNKVGVIPDIEVHNDKNSKEDAQLKAAMDYFHAYPATH